jgi:hypothetical protein
MQLFWALHIHPLPLHGKILTMNSSSFISKQTLLAPQVSNLCDAVGISVSSVRHPASYPLEGRAAVQGGSSLRTLCADHRHLHVRQYIGISGNA